MYTIALHPFGYQLLFAEPFDRPDSLAWLDDLASRLVIAPPSFGMILELRDLACLSPDLRRVLAKGMQMLLKKGLHRSAVVVPTSRLRQELTWLARTSGAYHWERYLSAEETPDWHPLATSWVIEGLDPDLAGRTPTPSD